MASRARLEGICDYKLWTTEELIEAYAFEAKRINHKDREDAQRLIKRELKRRFDATLRLLDDEQTTENPQGTYRYLLNE
jgi:ribosomal protein L16/L10AE